MQIRHQPKVSYKWIHRYEEGGIQQLDDWPRRPKTCPHRMPDATAKLLVECRKSHPTWGSRKLVAYLARQHPDLILPANSTAGDLLKREGLVQPKRRRVKHAHPGKPYINPKEPNDIWAADFKSEFKTKDGIYCYPLTVTDLYSRFLIGCVALTGPARIPTQQAFHIRPHDHLNLKTPASLYKVTARRELHMVPPASYPKRYILRKVSGNSAFRWHSRALFVSHTLEGESVGIEEVEDGIFSVWYRDFLLGRFNERESNPRVL